MCTKKECANFFRELDDVFAHNRPPQVDSDIKTILEKLLNRRDARADGKVPPTLTAKEKQAAGRLASAQLALYKSTTSARARSTSTAFRPASHDLPMVN